MRHGRASSPGSVLSAASGGADRVSETTMHAAKTEHDLQPARISDAANQSLMPCLRSARLPTLSFHGTA
jgi:hypothetical protein